MQMYVDGCRRGAKERLAAGPKLGVDPKTAVAARGRVGCLL